MSALQDDRRPRVLIAADALPTRTGLRLALEQEADCVEVPDGPAAVDAARLDPPDVCIMDLEADRHRLRPVKELHHHVPAAAVIVITPRLDEDEFMAVVRAGASGYLSQHVDPARLPYVIRSVMRGETAFPRRFVRRLIEELRGRTGRYEFAVGGTTAVLTAREWQVIELLRAGHSTKAIAERLGMSPVTARRHVASVEGKVGARTRAELLDALVLDNQSFDRDRTES